MGLGCVSAAEEEDEEVETSVATAAAAATRATPAFRSEEEWSSREAGSGGCGGAVQGQRLFFLGPSSCTIYTHLLFYSGHG